MGTKSLVSITEFAKFLKVSRSSVYHAIKSGRLEVEIAESQKFINKKLGAKQWQANLDQVASKKKKGKSKKSKSEKGRYEPPPKIDSDGDMTLAEADRQDKVNRAKLSDLKFQEQSKLLIQVDKVEREAFSLARKTRDAVMSIPNRHAHELAVETDPHKLETKLIKILQKALQRLITEEEKRVTKKEKEKEKNKPKVGANDKG